MKFEFDPTKDALNQTKHGLSLADGAKIFKDDNYVILPTIREEDGEKRYRIIGAIHGKLHTAVFVWRSQAVRFISVRRGNHGEEKRYRTSR